MQREREREKGRRFSPLLHRDSASLLPFQGYSCVAFRTGTFQHFRFALSSRNLSYLPAGGIKIRFLPISVPGFFSFALHGIRVSSVSSFGSCQFSSILFLSLFLSLSLSLSLGGFEKESRLTSVVRPIRPDRSSRLALRARVRRTIRNERIRNRIGI